MAIASGVTFPSLGTHAGVPTNFARKTSLDDRYALGTPAATNPDVTGGASTHTHATSHTHTVGSHTHAGITTGAATAGTALVSGTPGAASATHTHAHPTSGSQSGTLDDAGTVVTASGSSLPDSYGVIWIESNGSPAGIPNGREALWSTGTPPASWTGQAGPAGKYLVGAATGADAGTTSGSATHLHAGAAHTHVNHDHTHTLGATGTPSATSNNVGGATAHGSGTHTHTATIAVATSAASGSATSGNSGSTNVAPAYYKLGVIRNGTGGDDFPNGIIGAWLGTLASIPSNWLLCDGTNGTPDLRDKMIIAAASDLSDVGGTGGATSHDHTDPGTHTHAYDHTHTIATSGGPSATTNVANGGAGDSTTGHTHTGGQSGSAAGSSGATSEAIANATAYPPNRTVAWIKYQAVTTNTRTITPALANLSVHNTRTITPAKANLYVARSIPALANLSVHNTRTVTPALANLSVHNTRTITPALANLSVHNTRTITPAKANLYSARLIPAAANLSVHASRTVPALANLSVHNTRTVTPAKANLFVARLIPAAAQIAISPVVPPPPSNIPTAAQVAAALSGRTQDVPMRYRYSRRTRTNVFIDDIIGIDSPGVVTLDNSRAVVRDLTVTFNAALLPEDFNPSADIIGVAVELYVAAVSAWVSMPLGLFVLDVSETHNRAPNRDLIPAKGADLAMLLVRNKRTAPVTVLAGSNPVTEVEAIATSHGLVSVIPATTHTLPYDITWPAGVSDYQIAADLMFGINYYQPWVDPIGQVRSRERIDPDTETSSVAYRDDLEPKMIEGRNDYVHGRDPKLMNLAVIVLDDPRNAGFGFEQRENADTSTPNSTGSLVYGTATDLDTSSATSPTQFATAGAVAHGLATGVQVLISGHSGATPDLNGSYVITVTSPSTFTIPIAVSVGGTGGTVQATTVQRGEWKGDSAPSTKAVIDATVADEIATSELRWAAALAQPATLPTFPDPRRDAHEFYTVTLDDGTETTQLFAVLGWTLTLAPGQVMQHTLGRVNAVTVLSTPKL